MAANLYTITINTKATTKQIILPTILLFVERHAKPQQEWNEDTIPSDTYTRQ